jgi:uncharacterized membrane protein
VCLAFGVLGAIFWIAIIALTVWAMMRTFPDLRRRASDVFSRTSGVMSRGPGVPTDSAEEILRGRFARGEMNAEEYERDLGLLRRERSVTRGGV